MKIFIKNKRNQFAKIEKDLLISEDEFLKLEGLLLDVTNSDDFTTIENIIKCIKKFKKEYELENNTEKNFTKKGFYFVNICGGFSGISKKNDIDIACNTIENLGWEAVKNLFFHLSDIKYISNKYNIIFVKDIEVKFKKIINLMDKVEIIENNENKRLLKSNGFVIFSYDYDGYYRYAKSADYGPLSSARIFETEYHARNTAKGKGIRNFIVLEVNLEITKLHDKVPQDESLSLTLISIYLEKNKVSEKIKDDKIKDLENENKLLKDLLIKSGLLKEQDNSEKNKNSKKRI